MDTSPGEVFSYQFDLSLNGFEVAGGSIRIHNPELQTKIFDLIGFSEKEKSYFKHMLEAFRYGCAAARWHRLRHRQAAYGFGEGKKHQRGDGFPKTGEGRDLLMEAPAEVGEEQLKELGIKITG